MWCVVFSAIVLSVLNEAALTTAINALKLASGCKGLQVHSLYYCLAWTWYYITSSLNVQNNSAAVVFYFCVWVRGVKVSLGFLPFCAYTVFNKHFFVVVFPVFIGIKTHQQHHSVAFGWSGRLVFCFGFFFLTAPFIVQYLVEHSCR